MSLCVSKGKCKMNKKAEFSRKLLITWLPTEMAQTHNASNPSLNWPDLFWWSHVLTRRTTWFLFSSSSSPDRCAFLALGYWACCQTILLNLQFFIITPWFSFWLLRHCACNSICLSKVYLTQLCNSFRKREFALTTRRTLCLCFPTLPYSYRFVSN